MKKPDLKLRINENVRNWLIALAIGIAAWLVVTMNYDENTTREMTAWVNFNYNTAAYSGLGVSVVNQPEQRVTVKFEGSGTTLGEIDANDFVVYPDYSAVRGGGEITLNLIVEMVGSRYNSVKPTIVDANHTVDVVFATVGEKTFNVSIDSKNVQPAQGFILNRMVANPVEITIRGPETEIEKVSKVVAHVDMPSQPLNETVSVNARLEPQDQDGNPIALQYASLSTNTAEVTLLIYQIRDLPLTINFINVPVGFDISTLRYHLDQETMTISGPERTLSGLTDISVASFDLSTFEMGRSYPLALQLPNGLSSQDGITAVNLTFDTEGMSKKLVSVSNIRIVNATSENVEIITGKINNVTLIGPEEELEALSASQVEAQILGEDITVSGGQQNIPVQIVVPAYSNIFAAGSYTATVQVD